ncbi:hypothetical protein FTX61_01440 [Nitriliruptoraceae bacterium ZYF776]|nr:hypothetical protein [Profundirhabdus halotolerans]
MPPPPLAEPGHLDDLLGDADPDVRLRAALAIGEGRLEASAPALVRRFGEERDFAIRETLTWATLRVRDAGLPLVRDAVRSDRWLARLQAAHTLSKVGDPADAVHLRPLVHDPVDAVAARAYWAVAQCGDPVVVPALVAELSRGSAEHRNSLTVALTHFGAAAVPALVGALRHAGPDAARRHAADTLALLGSPDADAAVDALADAVDDRDEWVRVAALNALGQLHLARAWERVDEVAEADERRLRVLAGRLGERRPSARRLRLAALRGTAPPLPDDQVPTPTSAGPWSAPDLDLVTLEGGPKAAELAPKLALQVAVGRPRYGSRADVPIEVLDAVRDAAAADAEGRGLSAPEAERVAAGRVEQHVHDTVLLEQVSVADPGMLVRDLLFGSEVHVTWFAVLDR